MSKTRKVQIDFRKYRSAELVQSVLDLIDIRGLYVSSVLTVFCIASLLTVLVCVLFWTLQPGAYLAGIFFLGLLLGNILGGWVAIIRIVRRSLGNMLVILDQLLDLTKKVAMDARSMSKGDAEVPTARQLVNGVYGEVFLPILETAAAEKLGFFGKPVLFVYRRTFGRLVRLTIRLLPESEEQKLQTEQAGESIRQTMQGVADNEDRIVRSLTIVQDKIHKTGNRIRFVIMLPTWLLLGAMIVFVILVFLILYLLVARFPGPEVTTALSGL